MYNPFIKGKIKSLYKKGRKGRVFHNLDSIHTIILLFDTTDYEEVDAFIRQLGKMGKQLWVYAYKNKKDEYNYSETSYFIINEKEATDLFNNKLNSIVEKVGSQHYDALFDLSIEKNPVLELLALAADADLKVGYKKEEQTPYDLAISPFTDKAGNDVNLRAKDLTKQMVHYLHTIRR